MINFLCSFPQKESYYQYSFLRGLCAEVIAFQLKDPENYLERIELYGKEIRSLLRDTDIWPLDRMHNLFHGLHKCGADLAGVLREGVYPLIEANPDWYRMEHNDFINYLEGEKERLMERDGG